MSALDSLIATRGLSQVPAGNPMGNVANISPQMMALLPDFLKGIAGGSVGTLSDIASIPLAAYTSGFSMGNGQYPGAVMGELPGGSNSIGRMMGADVSSPAYLAGDIGAPDLQDAGALLAKLGGGKALAAVMAGSVLPLKNAANLADNVSPIVGKGDEAVSITSDLKAKALAAYNAARRDNSDMLDAFHRYNKNGQYSYELTTLEDAVDQVGDIDELRELSPKFADILEREGSAVSVSRAFGDDVQYFSKADAPSEADFWANAMASEGFGSGAPLSDFDDILKADTEPMALHSAFEAMADSLDGYKLDRVDGSGDSAYYWLTRPLTAEEAASAGDNANSVDIGIRVSNHSKQSDIGHIERGKHRVDINIAPKSGGKDNAYHSASDFAEAFRKINSATVDSGGNLVFK